MDERGAPGVPVPAPYDPDAVRIRHSPGMASWLVSQGLSLAYTSYATGRLIVAGVGPEGKLYFNEQDYVRAMAVHYAAGALYVASLHQIWRLGNMLAPGEYANRAYDCVLVPRTAFTTGYLDVHALAYDRSGRILFVNTRYSCLATTDAEFSFRPLWKPPFISQLAPEDRCHLNGLAMEHGLPRYVTALSPTDTPSGWRENRADGGVLIDVQTGRTVTDRLSMPHSPRLHEGAVWALDSGHGYLVRINPGTGGVARIAFCPGFLRGLAFHNGYALMVASKPREHAVGLPFQDELARRGIEPWCAILVVDPKRGEIVEFIRYEAGVDELFDLAVLPGVRNPITVGPSSEEVINTVRFNPHSAPLIPEDAGAGGK